MLCQYWPSVCDAGPILTQHWGMFDGRGVYRDVLRVPTHEIATFHFHFFSKKFLDRLGTTAPSSNFF